MAEASKHTVIPLCSFFVFLVPPLCCGLHLEYFGRTQTWAHPGIPKKSVPTPVGLNALEFHFVSMPLPNSSTQLFKSHIANVNTSFSDASTVPFMYEAGRFLAVK